MEGFKKLPKMQCFKEGGHIKSDYVTKKELKLEEKRDESKDKAMIKKSFKQHDEAEHDKEPTEIKLKRGGRAKKDCGTVKKYKTGGGVYGAKKDEADKKTIAEEKKIVPKKAAAPSKAAEKPNFRGSDAEKEKSKPSDGVDKTRKVKPTGDKKAVAPSAALTETPFQAQEDLPGYADGRSVAEYLRDKFMGTTAQNAQARRDMQNLAQQQPGMMGRAAAAGNAMDAATLGAAQPTNLGRAATNAPAQPGITPGRYNEGGDVHIHHHYHGANGLSDPY